MRIGVFDFAHLRHQISDLDDSRMSLPPREDQVQIARLVKDAESATGLKAQLVYVNRDINGTAETVDCMLTARGPANV